MNLRAIVSQAIRRSREILYPQPRIGRALRWGATTFIVIATGLTLVLGVAEIWTQVYCWTAREAFLLGFFAAAAFLFLVLECVALWVRAFEMRAVRIIGDEQSVAEVAVRLLKRSRRSLYYYGGAGLIGDDVGWREELLRKLDTRDFTVKRLIDLKSVRQIQKLLKDRLPDPEHSNAGEKYSEWLRTHADYLYPKFNNYFYNFEGAPIWRYAAHYLIFDQRDILLVYPSRGMFKNAMLIENFPEGAASLAGAIEALIDRLGKRPVTSKELIARIPPPDKQAGEEPESGRPARRSWIRWGGRVRGWLLSTFLRTVLFTVAVVLGLSSRDVFLFPAFLIVMGLCLAMAAVLFRMNRAMADVELADSEEQFVATAVKLLRGSQKSLHYFGGIGLIGDYEGWKRELRKKMEDESFVVRRLIDLKHCQRVVEDVWKRSHEGVRKGGDVEAARTDTAKALEKARVADDGTTSSQPPKVPDGPKDGEDGSVSLEAPQVSEKTQHGDGGAASPVTSKAPETASDGDGDVARQDPIKAYNKWVETQARFLDPWYNTFVYPADGAPVWKYAIHYMVFDENDIALVYPCRGMYKNAIFIRNVPQRARALIECIDAVIGFLGLEPLTERKFREQAHRKARKRRRKRTGSRRRPKTKKRSQDEEGAGGEVSR